MDMRMPFEMHGTNKPEVVPTRAELKKKLDELRQKKLAMNEALLSLKHESNNENASIPGNVSEELKQDFINVEMKATAIREAEKELESLTHEIEKYEQMIDDRDANPGKNEDGYENTVFKV